VSRGRFIGVVAALSVAGAIGPTSALAASSAPVLRIAGNHFVDGRTGKAMRLFAIHYGTSEWICVSPIYEAMAANGVWDVPTTEAEFAAIRSWHANAIRIPLNEQCWLGVNPVQRHGWPGTDYRITPLTGPAAQQAGARLRARYRAAIEAVIARAHRHGLAVILDLHWSAAGAAIAWGQWPLPDRQYSIPFWRSVATTFKNDPSVAFEIFNEPFMRDLASGNLTLSWRCLRDGCRVANKCADCGPASANVGNPELKTCAGRCPTEDHPLGSYQSAGTQDLVDTIRATGARQPILVPGRDYTNDLSKWRAYMPHDPLHQLAASFHNYQGLPCDTEACWNGLAVDVGNVPIVTTEFGGDNTGQTDPCPGVVAFDDKFMSWADQHGVSYTGFGWTVDYFDNPKPRCSYDLLDNYDGTPRYGHGQAIHDHFVAVGPAP
jgi:endoglucanase